MTIWRGGLGVIVRDAQLYIVMTDLGIGDGQGGLVCCDSWGRKELDMTERLI